MRQSIQSAYVKFDAIKSRRLKLGLTSEQAAHLMGWDKNGRQRWSNLETGRHKDPRISTLFKVAKVLRCRVTDLLIGRR